MPRSPGGFLRSNDSSIFIANASSYQTRIRCGQPFDGPGRTRSHSQIRVQYRLSADPNHGRMWLGAMGPFFEESEGDALDVSSGRRLCDRRPMRAGIVWLRYSPGGEGAGRFGKRTWPIEAERGDERIHAKRITASPSPRALNRRAHPQQPTGCAGERASRTDPRRRRPAGRATRAASPGRIAVDRSHVHEGLHRYRGSLAGGVHEIIRGKTSRKRRGLPTICPWPALPPRAQSSASTSGRFGRQNAELPFSASDSTSIGSCSVR